MSRRTGLVLLFAFAAVFAPLVVVRAQEPSPSCEPPFCETPTPSPTATPPCIPGLTCPRVTATPRPTATPKPTAAPPTRTPTRTVAPTPSSTVPARTASPSPTPLPTPSPTATPTPASPNRGLATLGLLGSAAMIAASAWIWRRYLS